MNKLVIAAVLAAVVPMLPSCAPEPSGGTPKDTTPTATNRLSVPPEVVNNLGITFATATRGRLGQWRSIPGELEVPESRRWTLRAPVRARVLSTVSRWQVVEQGARLATLASSELQEAQRTIELAQRTLQRATAEVVAARARLIESEAHVAEAAAFEQASRDRLDGLLALSGDGNALTAREIIEARGTVTEASKARLDAAVARDDLAARVATRQIEADQARLTVTERLSALAVTAGLALTELEQLEDGVPGWRRIDSLEVRAPAAGIVVELFTSPGEVLESGTPIAQVFDTRELRFRGHLPEGDLGMLQAGNPIRLEFPSRRLQPIETRLEPPLPIADAGTRMIHVEAVVPNVDGALAHGMSVMAQVQIAESASAEVLLPERCVVFDGLDAIVFKRDPDDPNVVIRTPVELGARATGQIEVFAGVLDGDEVVADGVQQLKQTGLGKTPEGGHVHADGTWHGDHK